jgi:hypothetical protein
VEEAHQVARSPGLTCHSACEIMVLDQVNPSTFHALLFRNNRPEPFMAVHRECCEHLEPNQIVALRPVSYIAGSIGTLVRSLDGFTGI